MDLRERIEQAHDDAAVAVGLLSLAIAQSKIRPLDLRDAKTLLEKAAERLEEE